MSVAALQALLAPIFAPGPVILADQNGSRPAKPYATLAVTGADTSGGSTIELPVNAAGIVAISEHQRLNVEVQCFGVGSFALAQAAGLRLRFPSHVLRAEQLNIGVSLVRRALRVPELLNQSQYEERGILEFTAYMVLAGTDDVGLIEHTVIVCQGPAPTATHPHVISSPTATLPPPP